MVNIFWERFYNACIAKNTKPNPVAKEIGVSSGIVTKWKTVGTLPNGETLIKIADYLDCSVDYLLGRTDYPDLITTDSKNNYVVIEAMSPPDNTAKIAAAGMGVTKVTTTLSDDELIELIKKRKEK